MEASPNVSLSVFIQSLARTSLDSEAPARTYPMMKGKWTEIQTIASIELSVSVLIYGDRIYLTGYHMSADSVSVQIVTVYGTILAETVTNVRLRYLTDLKV